MYIDPQSSFVEPGKLRRRANFDRLRSKRSIVRFDSLSLVSVGNIASSCRNLVRPVESAILFLLRIVVIASRYVSDNPVACRTGL